MPGNLVLTQPDAVMPQGLMAAFSEDIERPALIDGMGANGETVRFPQTTLARRVFRMSRRLPWSDPLHPENTNTLTALRTFLLAHKSKPFWFYHLKETVPVGSFDPTGVNPVGRYAVVWQGGLTQSRDIGSRGTISIELREVEI